MLLSINVFKRVLFTAMVMRSNELLIIWGKKYSFLNIIIVN